MSEENITSAASIRNLSMRFSGRRNGDSIHVLENVNADVGHGEFVCIVGPSGCGKSTLLNIVAGFLDATSGEVLVEHEPMPKVVVLPEHPPHIEPIGRAAPGPRHRRPGP